VTAVDTEDVVVPQAQIVKEQRQNMPILECKYEMGERVHIDGDNSIVGIISCIEWRRPDVVRYEVSWMHSGDAKFIIFDEWRLSRV
jgi:hypothetical protein